MGLVLRMMIGVALAAAAVEAPAAEPLQRIELGYVEFPPYTFTAADGAASGSFIHEAIRIFDRAGLDHRVAPYPAARLYDGLARGDVHLFLGIDTSPVIQGKVLVSRRQLGVIRLIAFTSSGGPPVSGPEDLVGLRVGLQLGYSYGAIGDRLRAGADGAEVHEMRTAVAGFRMLEAGRIDVMLHYAGPGEAAVIELGLERLARATMFELPCYLVLSKALPDAEQVMARLEAAMDPPRPERSPNATP